MGVDRKLVSGGVRMGDGKQLDSGCALPANIHEHFPLGKNQGSFFKNLGKTRSVRVSVIIPK